MLRAVRTAVVTTSYPQFAGDPSGHFVESEVRGLAQRGEDVTVIWPRGVDAFGWPGFAAKVRERPIAGLEAAAWIVRARRELVTRGPFDRVIAHWAVPCAWPLALSVRPRSTRGAGAAVEIVSHGGDVRLLAALPRVARIAIVNAIAARATSWRFVSTSLLAELVAALPDEIARRVEAIAQVGACTIAMPDVSAAIDARRRALGDARITVCVGRLVASKRVDAAIDYAARCGESLVIVGDGPERAKLEAQAARVAPGKVRFVGNATREDALAWIGAADAVIHASRAEGASTVLREAEALGVRVVRIA